MSKHQRAAGLLLSTLAAALWWPGSAPLSAQTVADSPRIEAERAGRRAEMAEAGAPEPSPRVRLQARGSRGPATVAAILVAQEGQTPAGLNGPIGSANAPFTNGLGDAGFTGGANDGSGGTDNFVWFDTGVVLLDSGIPGFVLAGGESTMGVGDGGEFIYSPSVDGDDAVWTHNGLLLVDSQPAPGFPAGTINTFNSRPQMRPNGQAYWVAGFNDAGGTTSLGRALYTSPNSTPGTISVLLRSDDMIGGFAIDRPAGIGFDYQLSDNGAHHIHVLLMDTGSTANDGFVYVDGALTAREGSPTGAGDNWSSFDNVSINDPGNHLFSGDTAGPAATDEFIAYDGVIAVREGGVLGGVTLTTPASVNALSLSNLGHAVHLWSVSGGTELLFFACDASDLGATSQLVLATGDLVDLDGNGIGDATVTDFNASGVVGPGLSLAEWGTVFVEVDLEAGAGELESVIRLELPLCGPPPAIVAAPDEFFLSQGQDENTVLPLALGNPGSLNVGFTLDEGAINCASSPDLPWLSASSAAGVIAPAGSLVLNVSFDSTGLVPGPYSGALCLRSSQSSDLLEVVNVHLTVLGTPAIVVSPLALASEQGLDEIISVPLNIQNPGTEILSIAFSVAAADCAEPGVLGWAYPGIEGGRLSPGGDTLVSILFNSFDRPPGKYTGLLCIASNDPANPLVVVSLALTVVGGPGALEIPALSGLGLSLLMVGLAVFALTRLRRR